MENKRVFDRPIAPSDIRRTITGIRRDTGLSPKTISADPYVTEEIYGSVTGSNGWRGEAWQGAATPHWSKPNTIGHLFGIPFVEDPNLPPGTVSIDGRVLQMPTEHQTIAEREAGVKPQTVQVKMVREKDYDPDFGQEQPKPFIGLLQQPIQGSTYNDHNPPPDPNDYIRSYLNNAISITVERSYLLGDIAKPNSFVHINGV